MVNVLVQRPADRRSNVAYGQSFRIYALSPRCSPHAENQPLYTAFVSGSTDVINGWDKAMVSLEHVETNRARKKWDDK
ncbi:hypothetical protein K470DRAFT_81416 [Piedraia hortae CBS 480.64]|uniref:Uncharacterized protein n=1 Tax=Piedraia hortae CBS 480.64 TaxID=1314780 RepID=A0A6A7C9H7_9PEZI|nr:hypothetical protein K470DRAFT_81416 [Piedraia hortae CBS 480.64]